MRMENDINNHENVEIKEDSEHREKTIEEQLKLHGIISKESGHWLAKRDTPQVAYAKEEGEEK